MANYFLSDYFSGQILQAFFSNTPVPIPWPTTMYLALLTSVPSPSDSAGEQPFGEKIQEPNDPKYKRAPISQVTRRSENLTTPNWSQPVNRVSYNLVPMVFPTPSVRWGPLLWGAFCTQQTNGYLLYAFKFSRSIIIPANTPSPTAYPKSIFITIRGG